MTVSKRRHMFLVVSSLTLWTYISMQVVPRIVPLFFASLVNDDQYFMAVAEGRTDIVEPFMEGAGSPEVEKGPDGTLLQHAVFGDWLFGPPDEDQFDMVALLLAYGAIPNPRVYDGSEAPVVRAAEYCSYETFALLIAAGADPEIQLESGETIKSILERRFVPDRKKKLWLLNAALEKRRQAKENRPASAGPQDGASERT